MKMVCTALAVLVTVGSAAAGDPLAPLGRFAGEWEVDGKWSDGSPLRARIVCAWSLGKKIMTSKTFVQDGGKEYQRYEGIMAWHPEKKGLFQVSFAFDGTLTETLIDSKGKDTLEIGFTPFAEGKPSKIRQVIRFLDNDRFQWVITAQQGSEWKQLIDTTWKRKK
jgi:hypothetical protein